MSDEEEGGGGVGMTLIVVGVVGCGGLVMVAIVGALFLGARSSPMTMTPVAYSSKAPVAVVAAEGQDHTITELENGQVEEWTTMNPDGSRTFTRVTTEDGTSTELRLTWDAFDAVDEEASGLYENAVRVRALTDEERTSLGG